jgi:hypothetical protein
MIPLRAIHGQDLPTPNVLAIVGEAPVLAGHGRLRAISAPSGLRKAMRAAVTGASRAGNLLRAGGGASCGDPGGWVRRVCGLRGGAGRPVFLGIPECWRWWQRATRVRGRPGVQRRSSGLAHPGFRATWLPAAARASSEFWVAAWDSGPNSGHSRSRARRVGAPRGTSAYRVRPAGPGEQASQASAWKVRGRSAVTARRARGEHARPTSDSWRTPGAFLCAREGRERIHQHSHHLPSSPPLPSECSPAGNPTRDREWRGEWTGALT